MDAQPENVNAPSAPPTPPTSDADTASSAAPSRNSSSGPGRTKRSRTKHACDECRRTQKKCDGAKPTCRRCQLNDTQCTYTPHKSRRSCVCVGPHDIRRHRPLPGVCIFPSDHCSRTSKADVPSPGLPYLGNLKRPQLYYDSLRSRTVPSQSKVERNLMHLSYSESTLSKSVPPSPCPVIIPSLDVRYQADTSAVFVMPSPASTIADLSLSPLQQSLAAYTELADTQYLYDRSLSSFAPHNSAPIYKDNLHSSELIHPGNLLPLYSMSELSPRGASHSLEGRTSDPHPLPEASYQLSSSPAFSLPGDPQLAVIGLSHSLDLGVPQMFEEKQIQPLGRTRPHFPAPFDELAREIPPSHHSFHIPQSEQLYPYPLSIPQEERWSIGYSTSPLCESNPLAGSEISGFVSHQPFECYSGSNGY